MNDKVYTDTSGVRTVSCRTVAHGHLHQSHHVRDLPVRTSISDPSSLSAIDCEPNGLELLLLALGSCLTAAIHANAIARHIQITSLALELKADVDTSIHWGSRTGPKPVGFEEISVSVSIEADAPAEALNALIKHATLWSPVANTLYNPVHLNVALH